jgi:hypothetical protein
MLRLNTDLLLNCLAGLDDAGARARLTPSTNSCAFLATHLADSRLFLAALIGAPLPNPLAAYLAGARTLDDIAGLPRLPEVRDAWEAISAHLAVRIERLDTPALAASTAQKVPAGDGTVLGLLGFLVQHESYHIGQLALLRRQLGLPAMSYAALPREPGRHGA